MIYHASLISICVKLMANLCPHPPPDQLLFAPLWNGRWFSKSHLRKISMNIGQASSFVTSFGWWIEKSDRTIGGRCANKTDIVPAVPFRLCRPLDTIMSPAICLYFVSTRFIMVRIFSLGIPSNSRIKLVLRNVLGQLTGITRNILVEQWYHRWVV
jgi:hypothetical protein